MNPTANILGIDPGRRKTGVAVVGARGDILWRAIIAPDELEACVPQLVAQWHIARIALGDSTASEQARAHIESAIAGADVELRIVDETGSTLEARALYWADHPRRGWRALVPLSLQEPPEPIDDYAAVVVARRVFPSPRPSGTPLAEGEGRNQ